MSYLLAQIFICLLITGLIGLAIGWVLQGKCKKKLQDKNDSWTKEVENKNATWNNKIQGLMSTQKSTIENKDNELFSMKESLLLNNNKYKSLHSQNEQLILKFKQQEIDFNQKFKDNTQYWNNKVQILLKEIQVNKETIEKSNHQVELGEKRVQILIAQETDNKNESHQKLNELKNQLLLSQSEIKHSKETLEKENNNWLLKLKGTEEKSKAKELSLEKKLQTTEIKIQSLIDQELNNKALAKKELNALKEQLSHAQKKAQEDQQILEESNKQYDLKANNLKDSEENLTESQNKVLILEKQVQNQEDEINTSKNELSNTKSEFNQNLEKIEKEYKENEVETDKLLNALEEKISQNEIELINNKKTLEENNTQWMLKVKDLEEKLHLSKQNAKEESPLQLTVKDNLQLIKGIDEIVEKTLNELNIYQFQQIADWNENDITSINEALSFSGRIEKEEWIAQAKELIA